LLQYDRARTAQHSAKDPPRVSTSKDNKEDREAQKEAKTDRVRGYSIRSSEQPDLKDVLQGAGEEADTWVSPDGKYSVGPKSMLSVQLDSDMRIEIKDQIQMYAANHLLTHPLVSPALQPTLGGLPPLLIQTGGGELLRDEQIYIAHKAAQPLAYLPPPSNNQTAEEIQAQAARYKPTNVNIQVWDDLCHVCPTLSFTRPAKHMYRSIAQFGAWALARAQKKSIDIVDDDDISFISSGSTDSSESDKPAASDSSLEDPKKAKAVDVPTAGILPGQQQKPAATVGRAGDPLPPFENHMIRQRIDRHSRIYPLMAKEELVALQMPVADVGVPKKGPVSKWMKAQQQWNSKFAKQKIKIQKQRMKDMEKGFEGFDGEIPPPTALAGRRVKGMKAEKPKKRSWGMSMWAGWGSKHDSATVSSISNVLRLISNVWTRSIVKRMQIILAIRPSHQQLRRSPTNHEQMELWTPNPLPAPSEAVGRLLQHSDLRAHVHTPVTLPSPTRAKPIRLLKRYPASPLLLLWQKPRKLHRSVEPRHYPHPPASWIVQKILCPWVQVS
jgi:hypothetical protein